MYRQAPSSWVMKITNLSTRTLFGGFLGIGLAFILAEFSSRGLYDVYSTSTFFRTITGNSPNALADGLMKVSWALLFCTSWWMLWRLDFFFTLKPSLSSDNTEDLEEEYQKEKTPKDEETFKPEGDDKKEKEEEKDRAHSKNAGKQDEESAESEDSNPAPDFDEQDEKYFEVLKILDSDTRDFVTIKSVYRKKIAQYHPDKVSAMGPEIQEVAEQKAKEINEAYEHFRKKFSRN